MSFVYPYFLYALVAISIPVIIHLFNFRKYKTVYFTNVSFLKNVKQETKSKSQLKHLLVLLCRILAVASIVMAFSQPYLPIVENDTSDKSLQNTVVGIYIDNSFSMEAEGENGKLIEQAKKRAVSIAEAYRPDTKFMLQTNDFNSKNYRLVSREQCIRNIEEVDISPNVWSLSEIIARQTDFLSSDNENQSSTGKTIFLLSDFQKNTSDFQFIKIDTSMNCVLLPLVANNVNNLCIDSCWFENPTRKLNQAEILFVRVTNHSDIDYRDIPIKYFVDDTLKSLGSFNIDAGKAQTVEMSFTNTSVGNINARIEITDYPITFDNSYFISYAIRQSISVLSLHDSQNPQSYINALFSDDDYIQYSRMDAGSIRTNEFKSQDVIIIESLKNISSGVANELVSFVSEGGVLIFFPNMDGDRAEYNKLFSEFGLPELVSVVEQPHSVAAINYSSEIFRGVFKKNETDVVMPQILKYYQTSGKGFSMHESILELTDGSSVLNMASFNKGKVFAFSMSLDKESGSIARHPIFVPIIYNAALLSTVSTKLSYTIGLDEMVELSSSKSNEASVYHISNAKYAIDFIPQYVTSKVTYKPFLRVNENINNAGNYSITKDNVETQSVSFNFNRAESVMEYYTPDELTDNINKNDLTNFSVFHVNNNQIEAGLLDISKGNQLWNWFVILALLFLALEILLIRFWK